MGAEDYVEGFLEGHEPFVTRTAYRVAIASYLVLSMFCGAANLGTLATPGHRFSDALVSAAILVLVVITLLNIKWYRQDNQDPKHKRITLVIMLAILLLDVASCIAFHETMTYTAPTPPPTTIPPTPCPTFPPPPSPPNSTNTSAPHSLASFIEEAYAAKMDQQL